MDLELGLESSSLSVLKGGERNNIEDVAGISQPLGFQLNTALNITLGENLSIALGVNSYTHKLALDYYFHATENNNLLNTSTHYDFKFVLVGIEPQIKYRLKNWKASFGVGLYKNVFSINTAPEYSNNWWSGGLLLAPRENEISHVSLKERTNSLGSSFKIAIASLSIAYSFTPNWSLACKTYWTRGNYTYFYSDITVVFPEESNHDRINADLSLALPKMAASLSLIYNVNIRTASTNTTVIE